MRMIATSRILLLLTAFATVAAQSHAQNDECASAIGVPVLAACDGASVLYDATDATQSMPPTLCAGHASLEARDLWFSFVATGTGATVVATGTASFDPVVEAFEGSCGDLERIGCADETFPSFDLEDTSEQLSFPTSAGTTYFVRVYSYWDPPPADHTFTFCVYDASGLPGNDVCSGAGPVVLTPGITSAFTGDNTLASNTEGLPLPSLWHAFTVEECMDVTIDLCGTTPAFLNWSPAIYADCPATHAILPSYTGVDACAEGNISQTYSGLAPGTYYYPVFRDDSAATLAVGAYTVQVIGEVPTVYCEASFSECDETIGRVVIGAIDRVSGCAPGMVVDHTAFIADIEQGESLAIVVENGGVPYDDNSVTVWVDWDQDASFCGADEVFVLTSTDRGLTFGGEVRAPSDALPGVTRMRVRMGFAAAPLACGGAEFGEIEDYTMNVLLSNGVAEQPGEAWQVYRDPSDGCLVVHNSGVEVSGAIELFDASGRRVFATQRQLVAGEVRLDMPGTLAAGSYVVSISTANGRTGRRVVVN